MRILIFRHAPFEDIGTIRDILAPRATLEFADLYLDTQSVPDPVAYDRLIFMGGPMSVNDDLPFVQAELEILHRAAERRQPVLGICLGAQLIAKALGARVTRNPVKEIGWHPLHLTRAASQNPLFSRLHTPLEIFQWHSETFELPSGATLLATSELCRNQAFQIENFHGLQFHPEMTPEMIEDWCRQDCNCGDLGDLSAPVSPSRNRDKLPEVCRLILTGWVGSYK
jgi:GMP synthase-like glutamine amidotransferase